MPKGLLSEEQFWQGNATGTQNRRRVIRTGNLILWGNSEGTCKKCGVERIMIKAEVYNCNNITSANIQLRKDHLNIRYAMNRTGKSTIAIAIELDPGYAEDYLMRGTIYVDKGEKAKGVRDLEKFIELGSDPKLI